MAHSSVMRGVGVEPGLRRAWTSQSPSLSAVLVSEGNHRDLERTICSLGPQIREFTAQLVVVRCNPEPGLEATIAAAVGRSRLIRAPDDCTRADMRALGMAAAQGDIVTLRDDTTPIGDEWLSNFRQALLHRQGEKAQGRDEKGVDVLSGQFVASWIPDGLQAEAEAARSVEPGPLRPHLEKPSGERPRDVAASA